MTHLTFSCKRCERRLCLVRVNCKNFGSSKHGETILELRFKQKKNVSPLFCVDMTFEWYEDVMVFHVFISIFVCLFRTNVKKGHLDENYFRYCYGNFFESQSVT